jgi:hypothetical protein
MVNHTAATILEQLGGRRFAFMTGARNFIGSENALSFRLPGAGGFCKDGINAVRVVLDPSDTYTVTFSRVRGTKVTTVAEHADIYCEQLADLVSRTTGLVVRL